MSDACHLRFAGATFLKLGEINFNKVFYLAQYTQNAIISEYSWHKRECPVHMLKSNLKSFTQKAFEI